MKTIRNPLFWADVLVPLLAELKAGDAKGVKVSIDSRTAPDAPGIEVEVRVTSLYGHPPEKIAAASHLVIDRAHANKRERPAVRRDRLAAEAFRNSNLANTPKCARCGVLVMKDTSTCMNCGASFR